MGLEANCRLLFKGGEFEGEAHCGDGEIDFKGEARLRWRWADLDSASTSGGRLIVVRQGEIAEFDLGRERAEKWLSQIRNPKPRLDKLGLKPGHRYWAAGEFDEGFRGELSERAGEPADGGELDAVFVRLDSIEELDEVRAARNRIAQNGMIWAIWPKGRKEFREDDIRNYALANGLVDVKVASFSEKLSALKLVIPVALRKQE